MEAGDDEEDRGDGEPPKDEKASAYEYQSMPGYEVRRNHKPEGGPGRPAWEDIERGAALRLMRTYHDSLGGQKALDERLTQLSCGNTLLRRKRKRVRSKVAKDEGGDP